MGRNLTKIDWKKVDELMIAGCCGAEIAGYFGIHPDTLYKHVEREKKMCFTAYHQEKKAKGDSILRAHQYAKALGLTDKGDNTLLIWLGKTRLKQVEEKQKETLGENVVEAFDTLTKYLKEKQDQSTEERKARRSSKSDDSKS